MRSVAGLTGLSLLRTKGPRVDGWADRRQRDRVAQPGHRTEDPEGEAGNR